MADSGLFIKKKKSKRPLQSIARAVETPSGTASPRPSASAPTTPNPNANVEQSNGESSTKPNANVIEFKLFSSGLNDETRYNLMRMNSVKDVDPRAISRPILLNRKVPGPKAPPTFAYDDQDRIIGRYVYDHEGQPLMDANGEHVVEKKTEMDMSLVGGAEGQPKRKARRGVKEVYHQDIEVIRLRREENAPWVLESGKPKEKAPMSEHWVGRMTQTSSMPTVLLVNDGKAGMAFKVLSLGRQYKFDPERPFKVLDPDAANKLYEYQAKYKLHDRWAQREGGPNAGPSNGMTRRYDDEESQEQKAMQMEQRMRQANGDVKPRLKIEKFEDDYRREGRQLQRGLEGGADEDLDYDFNEEFQDDEENNTFYRDAEEEEDVKLQEEKLQKEFRMANANVGDRPQIDTPSDEEEEEEDLFGDKLNTEGKRLRSMMRKRRKAEDEDGFEGSEGESSDETEFSEVEVNSKEQDKSAEKGRSREPSAAPSDRPSRPPSRNDHSRGSSTPTGPGRRQNPSSSGKGKARTEPPVSGSQLLAQRAAGGARTGSPRRSRQTSPLSRQQSPDPGRSSPMAHGSSSPRGSSPTLPGPPGPSGHSRPGSSGGGTGQFVRQASPHAGSPGPSPNANNKRKPSPSTSSTGANDPANQSRKKRKGTSKTPTPGPEVEPFEGMIKRDEIIAWFRKMGKPVIPMAQAIGAFKERIRAVAGDKQKINQDLFLSIVSNLAVSENKMLRVKEGVLSG